MATKSGRKVHYGWVIVFAGVLLAGGTIGTFNNTLSVFIKPVTEDLGLSRGQFTLYNTIMGFSSMFMMPVFGELFRKGNMKPVMFVSACLIGVSAIGYSFSTELWHFYLFAVIGGGAGSGAGTMAVSTIINNWFVEKKGLATGIALAGTGLFGAVLVPIITAVVEGYGWRWGYRLMSVVGLAFLLPTIVLLVRIKPADMGLLPYGAKPDDDTSGAGQTAAAAVGFTRAEAFKMPCFYLVVAGMIMVSITGTGMQGHAISYFTDIGYDSSFASLIVSVELVVLIFGKMLMGTVFDRYGAMVGCISASVTFMAALVALLLSGFSLAPFVFAFFHGYGGALGTVAAPLVTARYFGSKDFSRIFAVTGVVGAVGSAIGQPFCGFVFDLTGSYVPAWFICLGIAAATIFMFVAAERSNRRAWDRLIEAEALPGER